MIDCLKIVEKRIILMVKYYFWLTKKKKKKYNQPLYPLLYNFYNYFQNLRNCKVSLFFIIFCLNERMKIGSMIYIVFMEA